MGGEPSRAVVTGAASGMGLATARHFLAEGWTVVAVDRDEAALDKSAAALRADVAATDLACDRFLTVAVDVTDRAALEIALDRLPADPPLRAVVNAAGIYPPTTLADFTEDGLPARSSTSTCSARSTCCAVSGPRLRRRRRRDRQLRVGRRPRGVAGSADLQRVEGGRGHVDHAIAGSRARPRRHHGSTASRRGGSTPPATRRPDGWPASPPTIPLGRVAEPEEIAHWLVFQLVPRGPYVTGETVW